VACINSDGFANQKTKRVVMTNEQQIEEILHEADAYGLRQEVIDSAKRLREEDRTIDTVTSYELAFVDWIK